MEVEGKRVFDSFLFFVGSMWYSFLLRMRFVGRVREEVCVERIL